MIAVNTRGSARISAKSLLGSRERLPRTNSLISCAFGILERGPIMEHVKAAKKRRKFDPQIFLSTIDGGRKIVAVPKKQTIFGQGDSSDAVFYIQKGKVKLTVVSKTGKEATIGVLNDGDFFGEGCLYTRRIWLTSFSILVKSDWLAFFSCLRISARRESPTLRFPRSVRKLWQRWWAQLARGSISS
jgi:Cyclic nucleotide-binding domain